MDKFHSLKSVPQGPSSAGSDGSLPSTPPPGGPRAKPLISAKGVENAKKRLRAFSIQKKIPKAVPTSPVVKNLGSSISGNTVLIGKLNSAKVSVKPDIDESKKPPKPPKPGATRKQFGRIQEYSEQQKQTLSEIEEMKRKMELVDLGIPLGLICPTATSEKAMPTKAMPPIKSFLTRRVDARKKVKEDIKKRMKNHSLTPEQLDEIIRDAKKAKAEGKKFKFDYERLLPDYDNPFQRKKNEDEKDKKPEKESDKKRSDKFDPRERHFRGRYRFVDKDDKNRERDRGRIERRDDDKNRDSKRHSFDKRKMSSERRVAEKGVKDSEMNLKDFLVCDSWSLDNDDKTNSSSPAVEKSIPKVVHDTKEVIDPQTSVTSPKKTESPVMKVEKLKPVVDSFKFELDSNDDEILDIFDEDSEIDRFSKPTKKPRSDDQDSFKDLSMDGMDDTFLESVINEIKQENLSEDESQDKSLVGYDESPVKQETGTPELDDSTRSNDYSDGCRSSESGYKSTDSLRSRNSEFLVSESPEGLRLSVERELDAALERIVSKSTAESLETWSFVLKICQPLLFRHDKNKCYKETRVTPKLWYTENPKLCNCVKDRSVVYEELEMCKMTLVDRLYGCDQISEAPPDSHAWYSSCPLVESSALHAPSEWELEEGPGGAGGAGALDQEYQRFMEAVWPEVTDAKSETSRSTTPVRQERKREGKEQKEERKSKKMKLSSEGWSQESDVEEEVSKKKKVEKEKKKSRKRKLSASSDSSSSGEEVDAKKKKVTKKKNDKKLKVKSAKRRRKEKLRKIKEKQKKKKKIKTEKVQEVSDDEGDEIAEKKKDQKQVKKKKQKKLKKKAQKKKKVKAKSSSSSSESSSDTEPEKKKKTKKDDRRKKEKKKRKHTTSESQSDEMFDENILNNIKTEKFEDNDKKLTEFSPRRQYSKRQEIINVKELQSDFVGNSIHIKKEEEDDKVSKQKSEAERSDEIEVQKSEKELFKEPPMPPPEESNLSQCSSQESVSSKDHVYEKDESHLRPSSQNSNYSFNDVINASQAYKADATQNTASTDANRQEPTHQVAEVKDNAVKTYKVPEVAYTVPETANKIPETAYKVPETAYKVPEAAYEVIEAAYKVPESAYKASEVTYKVPVLAYKGSETAYKVLESDEVMNSDDVIGYQKDEDYGHGDYEMYEQLAMAYQSDVANQRVSPPTSGEHSIETVALLRARGEIKCDWRAGDHRPAQPARPSRWGLKPGDVNIVLTGGGDIVPSPVYKIQSLVNRNTQDSVSIGYDEAYADVYAASDKLQYGDCFSMDAATVAPPRTSSLDRRINLALQASVLGEVAKEDEADTSNEKRKLATRSVNEPVKVSKRVSFADGYKPGQDSDTEEPPKKKKRPRLGCAWPCPATHPDHVPLWDALPPPPPPATPPAMHMYDPNSIPGFMPPEPPPGLMAFPPAIA